MDLIALFLLGTLGVFGAAFSKLLADECKAWAPRLVLKIISVAVEQLPTLKRERFSEEWKSHINEIPGDFGKIVVACGYLTAAWDIAEGPFGLRKRGLDLVLASCALLFLAPLLGVSALAVAMSSPGPILLRQTRIGRNGKAFHALKFRTTRLDESGFDRATKVGAILRKCSLDELPQLLNVFAGDMSLVGYQPIDDDPLGKRTELADTSAGGKPGMTGPWRFGPHSKNIGSSTGNWSLVLDLKIILATIAAMVWKRNDDEELEHTPDLHADWRIGLLSVILMAVSFLGLILLLPLLGHS
jgi:lipopolysaccharide/colanic/teichoic acid biosynthesis glycosyltransferase